MTKQNLFRTCIDFSEVQVLNYSIKSSGLTCQFDVNFNVKFCVGMMMSWIMLYVNRKYNPFMVVKARLFLKSNIIS